MSRASGVDCSQPLLPRGESIAFAAVATVLEKDIGILGSGELIQSLMRHNLIDEYLLLIHPLVLGSGRRLFPDGGAYAALRLVNSVTTTTGVVIATYRPASQRSTHAADRPRRHERYR